MNDIDLATRRAKHIAGVFEVINVPDEYADLSEAELKTHALARLGYSHSGAASALGVNIGTASRYFRKIGRTMGAEALHAAPPRVIEQWPYEPVCILGTRPQLTKWHYERSGGSDFFKIKRDKYGRKVYHCRHGKKADFTQSPSKRLKLSGSGYDLKGTKSSCKCTDPLIMNGIY